MGRPTTTYVRDGDVCIAYQVVGDGDRDIVLPCDPPTGSCDLIWDDPIAARFLRRLATLGRLVLYDLRGVGSSSPMVGGGMPPLQSLVDDLLAVLDVADCERAVLISPNFYAPLAWMFAAAHPNRAEAVIGIEPFARLTPSDDYPHGMTEEALAAFLDAVSQLWGTEANSQLLAPGRAGDEAFCRWMARAQRLASAPSHLVPIAELLMRSDLRSALPSVQAPALLLTRRQNALVGPEHSRHLAKHLPNARLVELPGADSIWYSADADTILGHIEAFLLGTAAAPPTDRVLATVLFTDIVNSTEIARALGDDRWTETLEHHDQLVRRHVEAFEGRWIKSTGDGTVATFDAPARAVLCADGLRYALADLGIDVRAGLHTGEIQLAGDDIAGIGVHIAARIAALAGPREVLVSSTVPPLVAGSSLDFSEQGTHRLKGIAEPWGTYRLVGS